MDPPLNAYLLRTKAIKRSLVTPRWLQHPTAEASYPTNVPSRPHNSDLIMPGRTGTVHLQSSARTRGRIQVHNTSRRYAAETARGIYPSHLPEQHRPQTSTLHRMSGGLFVPPSTNHTHQPSMAFYNNIHHQNALNSPRSIFVQSYSVSVSYPVLQKRIQQPHRTTSN